MGCLVRCRHTAQAGMKLWVSLLTAGLGPEGLGRSLPTQPFSDSVAIKAQTGKGSVPSHVLLSVTPLS